MSESTQEPTPENPGLADPSDDPNPQPTPDQGEGEASPSE